MKIAASAPGKLVLSGEYAVLHGAPALVLAMNRRASCRLEDLDPARTTNSGWNFSSSGFAATANHSLEHLCAQPDIEATDPSRICQQVLRSMSSRGIDLTQLPQHLEVQLDTNAFYRDGVKLGLGSSAALCVALSQGLSTRIGAPDSVLEIAFEAHRALQGGHGSGLDIATSATGGLVEFRRPGPGDAPEISTRSLPPGLYLGFFWSGFATSTGNHIERFDRWRESGVPRELEDLTEAATAVAEALPAATEFMRQLRRYADRLRALDRASEVGIYSKVHEQLAATADQLGAVYKPSGAGGGDIGIAFAESESVIAELSRHAVAAGISPLALGMEQDGIEVSRQ